ncbi:MAG TPA: aminoacyl--tRNA ligase-related protein [Candidatus Paceibacterota bacterium]|nr:aminoacyl--tRNA ligase-related protein [Candidatus Paceibacterota bacterium]
MRQSKLFTKTERSAPKDEVALNAQLLTRAGFVYKNSAGVYSLLPLGWRVIRRISNIIREEMDAVDGEEMLMSALHEKKYLTATGRWDVDVVYKVTAGDEKEPNFNISWTHEEVMSEIASHYVSSYKDLPFAAYQIQTKFRHEPRAKSGLLRGREFLMKDLYSFHANEKDLFDYYARVAEAYKKVFARCGVKAYYTLAAGGEFTVSNTHEFQVACDVGEDTIFVCGTCDYAENQEISKLHDGAACPKCGGVVHAKKAVEVGNIFPLGTKYAKAFDLTFTNEAGERDYVVMGSYGIGVTRLMGTIVELFHDDHGILWPASVAPFDAHLLALNGADGDGIYESLRSKGIDVLYDDRAASAGEKFAEADLIGIPWRIVTSPKVGDGAVEVRRRGEKDAKVVPLDEAVKLIK